MKRKRNPLTDSEGLASKLYEAGWNAAEIPQSAVNLSTADRGHPAVDTPERYRWFLVPRFKVANFGLRLDDLLRESGPYASHAKWRHDKIAEQLRVAPAWPAIVTADGVLVDGFHRVSANRTLRRATMPVVVAVERSGHGTWDDMWLESAVRRQSNPKRKRNAGRGDAGMRARARRGSGDPKIDAWRRGFAVAPDLVLDMGKQEPGLLRAVWFDPSGSTAKATVWAHRDVSSYDARGHAQQSWLLVIVDQNGADDERAARGQRWVRQHGATVDWNDALLQQAVARAYVGATARSNPSSDQRRRELERRAALGDPEAQAQLQALIYRAPATGGEALEAGDPVRLAWQAWQEGRGTLGEYEAARYVSVSGDTRATSYPWLGSAGAARRIPDQLRGFSPEAYSAIVLDTPQADAVLQAYTAATGKPWNTALTIGRGGPGTGFEGWRRGQKPTVKQAAQVVVAYYRSLGWSERPGMPGTTSGKQLAHAPLVSPDGQQRVIFSRTTLRRERRDGSRWVRDYSRDPTDQVGIVALAHALVQRAIRAKDWRANPGRAERGRQHARGAGLLQAAQHTAALLASGVPAASLPGFVAPEEPDHAEFEALGQVPPHGEYSSWVRLGDGKQRLSLTLERSFTGGPEWRAALRVEGYAGPHGYWSTTAAVVPLERGYFSAQEAAALWTDPRVLAAAYEVLTVRLPAELP